MHPDEQVLRMQAQSKGWHQNVFDLTCPDHPEKSASYYANWSQSFRAHFR